MTKGKLFLPKCPYCSGDRIHRHGRTAAGTPRYRCLPCNRTFIRRTGTPWHRWRRRREFVRFRRLLLLGNSIRHDARQLSVSPSTVWRWRHRHMAHLVQQQRALSLPQGVAATSTYTLLPRRTFWGNISNARWAARRGLDFLHARQEQQVDCDRCTAVTFLASRPERGAATFAVVTHSADTSLSALLEYTTADCRAYRITGTWAIPLTADTKKPLPLHIVLCDHKYRALNEARSTVLNLEARFRRWCARFRGVALRYLKRYVAWFNDLLARGVIDHQHMDNLLRWTLA